jgi:hypothetical protein
MFFGYVSCESDQVEPNNNLAPVTILISGAEPPPPPTVEAHATQHEAGGSDQLNLDDLPGRLQDAQTPAEHRTSHEAGGSDRLNVEGLPGTLATAQIPAAHGNDRHTDAYVNTGQLADHDTSDDSHKFSNSLEHTDQKGINDGYCGLDATAHISIDNIPPEVVTSDDYDVPFGVPELDAAAKVKPAQLPSGYLPLVGSGPASAPAILVPAGGETIVCQATIPPGTLHSRDIIDVLAQFDAPTDPGSNNLVIRLRFGILGTVGDPIVVGWNVPCLIPSAQICQLIAAAEVLDLTGFVAIFTGTVHASVTAGTGSHRHISALGGSFYPVSAAAQYVTLTLQSAVGSANYYAYASRILHLLRA